MGSRRRGGSAGAASPTLKEEAALCVARFHVQALKRDKRLRFKSLNEIPLVFKKVR
jgi:hypothetical protein